MTAENLGKRNSIAVKNSSGLIVPLDSVPGESIPPWISKGREVYRRGLILALDLAAKRAFPEQKLWVEHSISLGYRCRIEGMIKGSETEVCLKLKNELKKIVEEALPIQHRKLTSEEALDLVGEHSL
ncbi:MAG: hypothetical protein GY852_10950, partial [bacterium]|nr:hypothetical protein [bacterium]